MLPEAAPPLTAKKPRSALAAPATCASTSPSPSSSSSPSVSASASQLTDAEVEVEVGAPSWWCGDTVDSDGYGVAPCRTVLVKLVLMTPPPAPFWLVRARVCFEMCWFSFVSPILSSPSRISVPQSTPLVGMHSHTRIVPSQLNVAVLAVAVAVATMGRRRRRISMAAQTETLPLLLRWRTKRGRMPLRGTTRKRRGALTAGVQPGAHMAAAKPSHTMATVAAVAAIIAVPKGRL